MEWSLPWLISQAVKLGSGMSVHVKLSSSLRRYMPDYRPSMGIYADGAGLTGAGLALSLGIPLREIRFVMVNGHLKPMQTLLETGDKIAYFPAIGGG